MSCVLAPSKRNLEMESPFKPDILKGKVALLTGGGSGIGFEISTQFGKHGASIAIMGRRKNVIHDAVSVLQSLGIPAVGFEGDVRKPEDARRVVEATVEKFGKLDILVNAAAGNFLVPAEDLSPNGFKTVMDIDSVGTFTMCHEALKYLKKGGSGNDSSTGGFILNISATLHYTAYWYQIHVSAAKAAVDALTRNLALEWGTDYDIRVNGIAPGPIGDTTGMSKLLPREITIGGAEYMPLYKVGEKWDIAMAAIYLASVAGKYINGTTLVVDGGLWLTQPRHLPKEAVKQLSRTVEKRSRAEPTGIPASKL
ncbi:peroxisomal 2,4-dienoyl-CoA reductase [(3E)-enoyl-CoA-producing]-like isoform X2 [Primulina tabacum]|uniref:peroxisomal 2,4-dienoyl-CoA reductase [(3E)-enoyl-CoA-producing]-like isoform X2 n=1 Tax=Primulina tabacum TaxID=48773 RepID=UPI003F590BEE